MTEVKINQRNEVKPGDILRPANGGPDTIELVVSTEDGTVVRFNLFVGQTAEIIAGTSKVVNIAFNPAAADLVGVRPQ